MTKTRCPECNMPVLNGHTSHVGGCSRITRDLLLANNRVEPKGDCPFCDAPKWHVCDHFTGYVRGNLVTNDSSQSKQGRPGHRPKRADEVAVDTGVSVRAYSNSRKARTR